MEFFFSLWFVPIVLAIIYIVLVISRKEMDGNEFSRRRHQDSGLKRALKKIKTERIERQEEREKEKRRKEEMKKKKERRTTLESKKLEDLSYRSHVDIPRPKSHHTKPIKKLLEKGRKILEKSSKPKKDSKITKEEQKESFNNYLGRITNLKSWKNTSEYREKYVLKKQKIQKEKLLKQQKIKDEELKVKQEEERAKLETEQKKIEEQQRKEQEMIDKEKSKLSLDDYLNKRTKKKRFYFAEKELAKDLFKRKKSS